MKYAIQINTTPKGSKDTRNSRLNCDLSWHGVSRQNIASLK